MTTITILKHKDISVLREKLLKEQKGKCPICKRDIEKPVLDHHHTRRVKGSGRIRQVICNNCNILLGKVENNSTRYNVPHKDLPGVLRGMAEYLEREQLPYLHPSEAPKKPKLKKKSYNDLKKGLKQKGYKKKIPEYPKSGNLTKKLEILFKLAEIDPEFYKSKNSKDKEDDQKEKKKNRRKTKTKSKTKTQIKK